MNDNIPKENYSSTIHPLIHGANVKENNFFQMLNSNKRVSISETAHEKNIQTNSKYKKVLTDDHKTMLFQDIVITPFAISMDNSETSNDKNSAIDKEIFDHFSRYLGEKESAAQLLPKHNISISKPLQLPKFLDFSSIQEKLNADNQYQTRKIEDDDKLQSRFPKANSDVIWNNNKEYNSDDRLRPVEKQIENFISILEYNQENKLIKKRKIYENKNKRSMREVKEEMSMNPLRVAEMLRKSEQNTLYGRIKLKIKQIDIVVSCMLIANLILSIVDNEIYITKSHFYLESYMREYNIPKITVEVYEQMDKREITLTENILRSVNCLISVAGSMLLIIHYKHQVKLLKLDDKLSEFDTISSSGLMGRMFIEILICIIFYPPGVNYVIIGKMLGLIYAYNLNSIFSVIVMTKLYLILKLIRYCSRWTTDTAVAICRNYKVKPGVHFAIKCEMKKRPAFSLSILFLIALGLLGFSMRTFEYAVTDEVTGIEGKKGINDLQNLFNCLWLIIVTMTTVGYGDFYPRSHLGRFVGVVACIIGMLVLSLIVVFLSSISEFTTEEKKAYLKLKKLFGEDNIENKAACVILSILRLRRHKIRKLEDVDVQIPLFLIKEKFMLLLHLKRDISVFNNNYKVANSYAMPVDEMLKLLENKLKVDIQNLFKLFGKMDGVDIELGLLAKNQSEIQRDLRGIMKMQDAVSKYLVNINNESFLANSIRKKKPAPDKKFQLTKCLTKIDNTVSPEMFSSKIKNLRGEIFKNDNGYKKHVTLKNIEMKKLKFRNRNGLCNSPQEKRRKKSCMALNIPSRCSKRAKTQIVTKGHMNGILGELFEILLENEVERQGLKKAKTVKFCNVRDKKE